MLGQLRYLVRFDWGPMGAQAVEADLAVVDDESLQEFEWMRQVRNSTEYPVVDRPTATKRDVTVAIEAASVIVEACAKYVHMRG